MPYGARDAVGAAGTAGLGCKLNRGKTPPGFESTSKLGNFVCQIDAGCDVCLVVTFVYNPALAVSLRI